MQVSSEEGLLASCNWAENNDSLQWILQRVVTHPNMSDNMAADRITMVINHVQRKPH